MLNETAKFLSQCPYLENAAVKVNYLDTTPFACALLMTGVDVLLKQYADGGEKRSVRFKIAVRQEYSGANTCNENSAKRCERIEEWIKAQSYLGNLPKADNGKVPLSIVLEKGFEITLTGSVDARFEAEIKVVYLKES